jgi:hypothetical protein
MYSFDGPKEKILVIQIKEAALHIISISSTIISQDFQFRLIVLHRETADPKFLWFCGWPQSVKNFTFFYLVPLLLMFKYLLVNDLMICAGV